MCQFHSFVKEVHEQGVCLNSSSCEVLNSLAALHEFLFNKEKNFSEVSEFLSDTALNKRI